MFGVGFPLWLKKVPHPSLLKVSGPAYKLSIKLMCLYYRGVQNDEFALIYHWLSQFKLKLHQQKVVLMEKPCEKSS